MTIYYVYSLIDPRNKQPFYIGKGKGDRAHTHLRESNLRTNSLKVTKIKAIFSDGLTPIINFIQTNLSESDAFEMEKQLIAKYGRIDNNTGILCNMSDGGDGQSGRIPWNKGKHFSIEARKNMSDSRKNSVAAQECIQRNLQKMISINTGKKRPDHSTWMKENNPRKKVTSL